MLSPALPLLKVNKAPECLGMPELSLQSCLSYKFLHEVDVSLQELLLTPTRAVL